MAKEEIIDNWSFMDFKPSFGKRAGSAGMPTWVGEHHRRLQAYKLLASYAKNSARIWMDPRMSEEERASRREYGDPATLTGQIKTSLLGADQSIVVGSTREEQSSPGAQEQRLRMQQWADDENFDLKLPDAEQKAVDLGDAVYVLGWDPDVNRPRLTVWDPGFYFPVLDPTDPTDQFPDRVHIAYEYEVVEDDRSVRKYVRRITWELVDTEYDEEGPTYLNLPWNEEPTTEVCLMSDATWLIDDLKNEVDDFSLDKARWATVVDPETGEEVEVNRMSLGIDFIPVVHIPNTPAGSEHFGTSSLALVLQIIDDLISTDTDLQAASATTGSPPIAVSGSATVKNSDGTVDGYGPGTLIETGEGSATMIDTSRSLDALLKYDDHLLSRLSVNGRVPESLMGRIKPSEVPSGIALSLSFAPHASMIQEMRKVRAKKYKLLFKFVHRFLWAFDDDYNPTEELQCTLAFGTFLPADRKETVDLVTQLLQTSPPAISLGTAVRMLVEAGFPIEDAGKEIDSIIKNDFSSAGEMLDATGDPNLVRKRLGLPQISPEPPDPIIDPGRDLS